MKVTDLRRKLLASLAAGGLLAPSAAYAADLNTNLVVNGDFETVDLATTSTYNSPRILNWLGTPGFAYSHDGSSSNTGVVPDYASGPDPPSAGHWYFSPNLGTDKTGPDQFYQDIDVSLGATGTAIAGGTAKYVFSAYMSSYQDDGDFGSLHVDFRNNIGGSLGSALISDTDPGPANVWSLTSGSGDIPVGTATVRLSVFGTATSGGPDGYTDNVNFQVAAFQPALALTINRNDGSMTLSNATGSGEPISGYSITSAFEALSPASWRSITDNYDSGNPGPNQVDAAHAWSELTEPAANGDLSEADLQSGDGATLANGRTVNLGNAGTWIQNPTEDLVFQYVSSGQVVNGLVTYTGNGGLHFDEGDLNVDGDITSADWVILRSNQHANLSALSLAEAYRVGDLTGDKQNNHADFIAFKSLFDAENGAGAFVEMLSAPQVPEPASILLVLMSGLFVVPARRRSKSRT